MLKQIVFLGPPGVGKGTYARRVAPKLGFQHVSPGDILRELSATDPQVRQCLDSGKLLPESLVFELIQKQIDQCANTFKGVILDGFPRSKQQAASWIERTSSRIPDLVVEFHLPETLLVEKLIGRRVCISCGDLYNLFSITEGDFVMPAMLPKQTGLCDKCGGSLIQRSDDKIDVIRQRLQHHRDEEKALIEFISQHAVRVDRFHVKTGITQLDELMSLLQLRLSSP